MIATNPTKARSAIKVDNSGRHVEWCTESRGTTVVFHCRGSAQDTLGSAQDTLQLDTRVVDDFVGHRYHSAYRAHKYYSYRIDDVRYA